MLLFLVDFDQQAFRRCVRCTVLYSLILSLFSCAADSQPVAGDEPVPVADAPAEDESSPTASLDSECVGPRELDITSVKIDTVSGGLLTNGRFESVNYQVTFSDGQRHQLNCLTDLNCSNPTNLGLGQDGCLKKNGCCDRGLITEKVLPDSTPCDVPRMAIKEAGMTGYDFSKYTNQEAMLLYEMGDQRLHKVSCRVEQTLSDPPTHSFWSSDLGYVHLKDCCDRGLPSEAEETRIRHAWVFEQLGR